jgi:hypothetical protein
MATRSLSFDAVRTIGMTLPDVTDASGSRGFALKVEGRLFACKAIHKSAEPDSIMVRIGSPRREALIAERPDTYYLTDHYVPHAAILVRLSRIGRAPLRDLLAEAWESVRKKVG